MSRRSAARVLATAIVVAVPAGCAAYTGGARSIDPVRLTADPGWIVAGATPVLHQRDVTDCGAAALAMIAGRWQVELTVAEASALLPPPTRLGIRLGDLRDAARGRGLTAFAIAGDHATLVHELRAGRPTIIGLWLPYGDRRVKSHYEVVIAVNPVTEHVATIDPAHGWRTRSRTALEAEWGPAGRPTLIVLGRTATATLGGERRRSTGASSRRDRHPRTRLDPAEPPARPLRARPLPTDPRRPGTSGT